VLVFVRVSVLFFLLRFCYVKTWLRNFIWCQIVLNLTSGLILLMLFIFICDPISQNWTPKVLATHCDRRMSVSILTSSLTIALDLLVLSVPFCVFPTLRMARRIKVTILLMFGLGLM